jgi:DNA-binding FadR family transcriptional regulator
MAKVKSQVEFEKLPARRSFEDVAARIRDRIAQGSLREGDRLPPERELAAMFGVSRNTVREALRALEHAGLLALKPGIAGGAFIRNSSAEVVKTALSDLVRLGVIDSLSLTEARTILGREVVRLACERHTADDMLALTENVRLMEEAAQADNLPLRANRNLEFHKILARATRNPVLMLLTDALVEMTREFVQSIGAMRNEFAIASRRRMLEHLRNRDSDGAVAEMTAYLETAQRDYLNRSMPERP